MTSQRTARRLRTSIAVVLTVPFVVPFLLLVSTTFRTSEDYTDNPGGLPRSFTLAHLTSAWTDANLGRAMVTTVLVCVVACLACGLVALAGAFWFHLHQNRAADALRWLVVSAYAIPAVAWLIPVFTTLAQYGLTNSLVITGLVAGVSSLPFGVYLIHTFYRQTLSVELLEAATLDGASPLRIFRSIAVPLSLPALASVTVLTFVWTFGDLLIASTLLQDPSKYTLTLATATLTSREDLNLQGQAAAALVALLPTIVVFFAAQRFLASGFGGGSGK